MYKCIMMCKTGRDKQTDSQAYMHAYMYMYVHTHMHTSLVPKTWWYDTQSIVHTFQDTCLYLSLHVGSDDSIVPISLKKDEYIKPLRVKVDFVCVQAHLNVHTVVHALVSFSQLGKKLQSGSCPDST